MEVAGIFIAYRKADIHDGETCVLQKKSRSLHTLLNEKVLKGHAGIFLYDTAHSVDIYAVLFDKNGKGSIFVFCLDVVQKPDDEVLFIGVFWYANVYRLLNQMIKKQRHTLLCKISRISRIVKHYPDEAFRA